MLSMILEFLKANMVDLLVVVVILLGILYLWYIGRKDVAKKIILSLVSAAEKQFGSRTGEIKYAFVVERAYNVLPAIIRLFITKKELDRLIEDSVQYLKGYLEDKTLYGYEDEMYFIGEGEMYKEV